MSLTIYEQLLNHSLQWLSTGGFKILLTIIGMMFVLSLMKKGIKKLQTVLAGTFPDEAQIKRTSTLTHVLSDTVRVVVVVVGVMMVLSELGIDLGPLLMAAGIGGVAIGFGAQSLVKDIISAWNIPILELDGYEADDIIGTISVKAEKKGFEVFMMTPDKDFSQLVTDKVFLYKPAYMGNSVDILGIKEVKQKWDIDDVDKVRDMLGLQGDSSDNIPGIPGIGPKTASKFLKEFGTVEGLIANTEKLKGKQKENVEMFFRKYFEPFAVHYQLAIFCLYVPRKLAVYGVIL